LNHVDNTNGKEDPLCFLIQYLPRVKALSIMWTPDNNIATRFLVKVALNFVCLSMPPFFFTSETLTSTLKCSSLASFKRDPTFVDLDVSKVYNEPHGQ
jgi:hypothetical protein